MISSSFLFNSQVNIFKSYTTLILICTINAYIKYVSIYIIPCVNSIPKSTCIHVSLLSLTSPVEVYNIRYSCPKLIAGKTLILAFVIRQGINEDQVPLGWPLIDTRPRGSGV